MVYGSMGAFEVEKILLFCCFLLRKSKNQCEFEANIDKHLFFEGRVW